MVISNDFPVPPTILRIIMNLNLLVGAHFEQKIFEILFKKCTIFNKATLKYIRYFLS